MGVIKVDTGSLDCSSDECFSECDLQNVVISTKQSGNISLNMLHIFRVPQPLPLTRKP